MSVVIKDMEMPETCEECPFHSYHSRGEYVCMATPMFYPMNLANSKGMRKEWCPLSEMPERWIPCSERLPEALQEVIVTSTAGYVYTSRIVHGEFEYGGNVIAWMPLPTPYLEEGEE